MACSKMLVREKASPPQPMASRTCTRRLSITGMFASDAYSGLNTSPGMSPYPFQEHGWLWPEQATWLNDKSADLNAHLRAHAEYYGFTFIDPTEAFAGHGVGSDDPWLLSLGFTGPRGMPPEAFHPTARGQEEIARLIDEHLRSLP